ncbi:MAG: hypothetical protein FWD03_02785 [Defluviitaleaceae bacterium]|nr:hypothetical protein [Defluviitaleaceae bacterium]
MDIIFAGLTFIIATLMILLLYRWTRKDIDLTIEEISSGVLSAEFISDAKKACESSIAPNMKNDDEGGFPYGSEADGEEFKNTAIFFQDVSIDTRCKA